VADTNTITANKPAATSTRRGASSTKKAATTSRTSSTRAAPKPTAAPRDASKISKEARGNQKPGSTPQFKNAFTPAEKADTNKPAEATPSQTNPVTKALGQGRVIAGQAPVALGKAPSKDLLKVTGKFGGLGAGAQAAEKFSRGDILGGAADTAHAVHGLAGQGLATPANVKPNPNAPKLNALQAARQLPGDAQKLAGNLKSAPGETLRTLGRGNGILSAPGASQLSRFTTLAGRAAPALGGAAQVYSAFDSTKSTGERAFSGISGGAKLAGAGLIATGVGAPLGAALIAGSTAADFAKLGWENREAITNAISKGAGAAQEFAGNALSGLGSAGRAALSAIPGGGAVLGGIGRLFG